MTASGTQPASPAERLAQVRQRIAAACRSAGRQAESVELCAVSKFQPVSAIEALLTAGQRVFGENRVQEAAAKWPALREAWPTARLHLIGSLQTNKAGRAVALFDAIESVDRERLAAALAVELDRQGRTPEVLVQVNIGREPQKGGVDPDQADGFIERCRAVHGLPVRGVMGVPPLGADPRPAFDALRQLAARHDLPVVSMGMSQDFPVAIAAGATRVRVGTALFGPRPPGGAGGPAAGAGADPLPASAVQQAVQQAETRTDTV